MNRYADLTKYNGSSPLARGLHRRHPQIGRDPGIIPARAGFTAQGPPDCRRRRDHPRSRGVYRRRSLAARRRPGSSPLARGLRGAVPHVRATVGIIPARAGFTFRRRTRSRPRPDHPRSRGVYRSTTAPACRAPGSSPLARGLHDPADSGFVPVGIIPARAGFTSSTTTGTSSPGDHPRSRGVYATTTCTAALIPGSSPLARGLRPRQQLGGQRPGIIPARAGFTGPSHRCATRRRDHPRSRGVYSGRSARRRGPSDHPRSRGVYFTSSHTFLMPVGSSPLARGLPMVVDDNPSDPGIIPARAGFTVMPRSITAALKDHPRSRGVYLRAFVDDDGAWGSSPLARGLRRGAIVIGREDRIIPARAGFTSSASCRSS